MVDRFIGASRDLPDTRLRGILDAVRAGQSQVWNIFSDSTGVQDATSRWPFLCAQYMAAELGSAGRVVFHQVRGTSEPTVYGELLKPIVMSPGTTQRGTQFTAVASGNVARSRQIAPENLIARTGDDLQIIFSFDPASATPAAIGVIGGQPGSSPNRGYKVDLQTNGNLRVTWYTNADAGVWAEWTPAQHGVSPGVAPVLMFTLDVDDGSGGWAARLYSNAAYSSAPGTTTPAAQAWGAALVPTTTSVDPTTGVTSVKKLTNVALEIGARGNLTDPFFGTVYQFVIYDGINGPAVNSPNIDSFVLSSTNANGRTVGTPTLHIYNGASAGKDLAWMAGTAAPVDALRPGRLLMPQADVVTLNDGHNEASRSGATIKTPLDAYYAQVKARAPMAVLHQLIQNPELDAASDGTTQYGTAAIHAARQREMANYARQQGVVVTDVFSAFMADARGLAVLINSTNPAVHPSSPAGYTLEAQVVARAFGLNA